MRGKGQTNPASALRQDQLVVFARTLASRLHMGQMYGDKPYMYHLEMTAQIARKYEAPMHLVIACYLHDILEDTPMSRDKLTDLFGEKIGTLIWRVTDEAGRNRRERHQRTWPKTAQDDEAVFIKLCDRLANTINSLQTKSTLIDMYRREYPHFKKALYRPGIHEALWAKLDQLYAT